MPNSPFQQQFVVCYQGPELYGGIWRCRTCHRM